MNNTPNQQPTESLPIETYTPRMIGMKFCSTCGASVFAEAEICIKCGVRLPFAKSTSATDKSRVAYAILCFFLWPLGVHEFYVGKPSMGVAWILGVFIGGIFTLGIVTVIMGIIAFVMSIVWLARSDDEFAQYVNNI